MNCEPLSLETPENQGEPGREPEAGRREPMSNSKTIFG
jgi:hypothetical protein